MTTPNSIYKANGVTVYEKIIPDGTIWTNAAKAKAAGFTPGSLYKSQRKLSNNTGRVQWITIHNTADIESAYDDGEQYVRATFNENMGSARVHFYIDDVCAWQNLKAGTGMSKNDPVGSAEIGWHAGDGTLTGGGNETSIGIEVVMGDKDPAHDKTASDNAARLTAWLMWKNNIDIDHVVTHTFWVNKSFGATKVNFDKQSTTLVPGRKWCPVYIFDAGAIPSTQDPEFKKKKEILEDKAYQHWTNWKAVVKKYLDEIKGEDMTKEECREICKEVFNELIAAKEKADEPEWSKKEGFWKKAKDNKIVDGTRPEGWAKRDEFIAILGRLGLIE